LSLFLDCSPLGLVTLSKTMRDMMLKVKPALVRASRDRRVKVSVKPNLDARETLDDLECPSRAEQAIQPAANDVIRYTRGDIPIFSDDSEATGALIKVIIELIQTIKNHQAEVVRGTSSIDRLREALENCEMCKPNREPPRTGCRAIPPPCFQGVSCTDLADGHVQCGQCPRGYIGDGRSCRPGISCRERPCFQGVQCYDTVDGFQCGPCPSGYHGDGQRCERRRGCDSSPCYSVRDPDLERYEPPIN
jgi:syndecan 4